MGSCQFCGVDALTHQGSADTCGACHSVSASTLPTVEELDAFYARFNLSYSGGGRASGAAGRQKRYARRYLSLVRRFRNAGRLIDIGSSTNPFPNYAAAAGFRVTALDYVRPLDLAPGVDFVMGPAELRPALAGRFDVVTAFAVVEHFRDPRSAVEAIASYAASGGLIFLMTPLVGDLLERNSLGRTRWFCPPEHLHLISSAGMKSLMRSFACEAIHERRFELDPARWAARYGIAAAEGAFGMALRLAAPRVWGRLRQNRFALSQQMALYVFRKK